MPFDFFTSLLQLLYQSMLKLTIKHTITAIKMKSHCDLGMNVDGPILF